MPWTRPTAVPILALATFGALSACSLADDRPADSLLHLTPAEAAVTVVVENLRDHATEFANSSLFQSLRGLPAYRLWQGSGAYQQFRAACREIEAGLGVDLATLRNELLGDAVVLSLHLGGDADPEAAHGLLLTRVRDLALLRKLIDAINASDRESGTLREVGERSHGGVSYQVRHFAEGSKTDEAYVVLDGGVFAWSNSEALIRGVIERHRDGGGLAAEPRFRRVREAMPADAVASLFLDPALLRQLREESSDARPDRDDLLEPLVGRYLAALEYVGIALELRDGLVLHAHEAIDPSRLDEPLRRWASRTRGSPEGLLRRLPSEALMVASAQVDFSALTDELVSLLDPVQQVKAENLLLALSGMLLGQDARDEVLPQVGPGVIAYLVRDGSTSDQAGGLRSRLALVVGLELSGGSGVSQAIENGLRTILALAALDPKRAEAGVRVESVESDGLKLTVLRGSKVLLAYYIEPGLLALGTSARAVSDFARGRPADASPSAFDRIKNRYFPGSQTFVYADLEALTQLAETYREPLARKFTTDRGGDLASTRRDLDQVLALARLFQAGYMTRSVDPGFRSVHHIIGLVARDRASGR